MREILSGTSVNDKEFTILEALIERLSKKEERESLFRRLLKQNHSTWNVASLSLIFVGFTTLTWVRELVGTNIMFDGKDVVTLLMGSRVGKTLV